jgi:hypothetical protein
MTNREIAGSILAVVTCVSFCFSLGKGKSFYARFEYRKGFELSVAAILSFLFIWSLIRRNNIWAVSRENTLLLFLSYVLTTNTSFWPV